jgi:hypothetical protein
MRAVVSLGQPIALGVTGSRVAQAARAVAGNGFAALSVEWAVRDAP